MRKILFAVVAALLLVSCGKEDPAKGIVVDKVFKSTATIKGVAQLSVNTTGTTVEKFVPSGTLLVFTIKNSEYHTTLAEGSFVKTVEVGENGTFEVELPAKEDGTEVAVEISGNPIVVDVAQANGKEEKQIFAADVVSQTIVKGLTYQVRLDYTKEAKNLSESDKWDTGSYTVELYYFDGKVKQLVKKDTEVKITIAGSQFTPEISNDLIFTEKVGENGILKIEIPAKSSLEGGLEFRMDASFSAELTTIAFGVESKSTWIFKMTNEIGTIYGDIPNNASAIEMKPDQQIEQPDVLKNWKKAYLNVKVYFAKDGFDLTKNNIAIPDDAKVTITEKRKDIDASLVDVVTVTTYAKFLEMNNSGYLAPNPAISDDPLVLEVKIDFITDRKTAENSSGAAINNKFKYHYEEDFNLRGDITTFGGSTMVQPDASEVNNAILLGAADYEQLTFLVP